MCAADQSRRQRRYRLERTPGSGADALIVSPAAQREVTGTETTTRSGPHRDHLTRPRRVEGSWASSFGPQVKLRTIKEPEVVFADTNQRQEVLVQRRTISVLHEEQHHLIACRLGVAA